MGTFEPPFSWCPSLDKTLRGLVDRTDTISTHVVMMLERSGPLTHDTNMTSMLSAESVPFKLVFELVMSSVEIRRSSRPVWHAARVPCNI